MGKAGMGQSLRFHSQNLFTATLGPHTWEWHLGAVSRRPCSTLKAPGLRIGVCVWGGEGSFPGLWKEVLKAHDLLVTCLLPQPRRR